MTEPDRPATGDAAADATGAAAPTPATESPAGAPSAPGADLDRRRFFRQFATDVFHTAATVVGAATALQRTSIDAASAILNGGAPAADPLDPSAALAAPPGPVTAEGLAAAVAVAPSRPIGVAGPAVGYHSAFRIDGERLILVDQRRLPFALLEVETRSAIEVANELAAGTLSGGPVVGHVAAVGLAQSARRIRASRPYARRAILRAAETMLLTARPASRYLRAAVERVMARYRAIGELDEDGERIADAMQAEADAILFEAAEDHGRSADAAAVRIPRRLDRPAGVLTLGVTGAMGGGQFGAAMGAIQAAVYAERDVHVFVLEGRPTLAGARVATWEFAQAGIAHTLLPDAAAGSLLQSGRVDLVLVGAEAIARNGDVANDAGTYPVAAVAGRHGVPVIVCAPLAAIDPEAADGRSLVTGERLAAEVTSWAREPLTLMATPVLAPILDVTPAGLITAFATEEGLIEGGFAAGLAAAQASRARRLPGSLAGATVIAPVIAPVGDAHG
jgi:methylthioribose-1-phosphate isomerase